MNSIRQTLLVITAMPAALALAATPALAKGGRVTPTPTASSAKSTPTPTPTSTTTVTSKSSPKLKGKAAAKPTPTPTPATVTNGTFLGGCSTALTTPNATACNGYYAGNILDGNSADIATQQAAIAALPGTFTWDGNWSALANASNPYSVLDNDPGTANPGLTNGNELDFGQTLFGEVIIGVHWGNIPDPNAAQGNVTVFWLFNLTTPTNFITLTNTQGWSNAVLYETSKPPPPETPEPATWAMMLVGFGAAGVAVRRSRRKKALASKLA